MSLKSEAGLIQTHENSPVSHNGLGEGPKAFPQKLVDLSGRGLVYDGMQFTAGEKRGYRVKKNKVDISGCEKFMG
jgi:hypothetical protein